MDGRRGPGGRTLAGWETVAPGAATTIWTAVAPGLGGVKITASEPVPTRSRPFPPLMAVRMFPSTANTLAAGTATVRVALTFSTATVAAVGPPVSGFAGAMLVTDIVGLR